MSQPNFTQTRLLGVLFLLAAIITAGWGILSRQHTDTALATETRQNAVIHVGVIVPQHEHDLPELILPGSLQAWTETPVYAHTNGYLKKWVVDIGDRVKIGQLIADIDTPDIDQQEKQGAADVNTAIANDQLAHITAERWLHLLPTHTVTQQDVDTKVSDAAAAHATLEAARANLARLHQLDIYKHITSPVNGVLTVRNIDIGALIDTGSLNGNARQLFHVADIQRMRIYVAVPEMDTDMMHIGSQVKLDVREHPGKTWLATMTNTAQAIDTQTHTLLVQLQVDNAHGVLLPGGYVEAHFKRIESPDTLIIPSNTLIFNSAGTQVAVIDAHSKVHLQPVIVGRDFGRTMEIRSGLHLGERVVVSPADSIAEGEPVVATPMQFSMKAPS